MIIKDGADVKLIDREKINEIRISPTGNYKFELWINDSLSYLELTEIIELRDEIQKALIKSIGIAQEW